ncbi:universal stress protein [Permianibacter sp. IMCC34836]|uniref:universal stress protein n=1 Tax=Permianibacter fluminis TaxID=2738515 RepID=UPI0015517F77|nr:universal stress protein [Permianibacter fluminis]NQD38360.1 universal stress protein [Permianibacter fluminis]
MFKHILVPIDGSDMSQATVQRALAFAKEAAARISFYHAQPAFVPPVIAGEGVIIDAGAQQLFAEARAQESKLLLARAATLAQQAGVSSDGFSDISDSPWQGIIAAAKKQGCDLIFMASHGRRGVSALLLGSETQKVLTHCAIPVLVYREEKKH